MLTKANYFYEFKHHESVEISIKQDSVEFNLTLAQLTNIISIIWLKRTAITFISYSKRIVFFPQTMIRN